MSENRQITMMPIASLLPAHRNPRTHSRKQIRQIADSIERFGFVSPILVSGDPLRIVAGHGRWAAAKLIGLADVPTLMVGGLSSAELRAYAIADNKIASNAGWSQELLALELAELEIEAPDLDLAVTGIEFDQIEILRDTAGSKRKTPISHELSVLPNVPPVTRLGDVWLIGEHRLLCGCALDAFAYSTLMGERRADLIITDPPYNVPVQGHVSSQNHREFEMASGEMSRDQFQRFLSTVCRNLARNSKSGSLHYLFMDWRSIADLIAAGEEHFAALLNIIVWVKPMGGMGSHYRSRHELVALFKHGGRSHTNNVELGSNGRNRTNVWEYAGVSGFGSDRKLGTLHPTVKNVDMIADAIRDSSRVGEVVLDPFGGSGTTLIAAQRTNRRALLIELDPLYCDLCVRRALAEGLPAVLASTGAAFEVVEGQRNQASDHSGDVA